MLWVGTFVAFLGYRNSQEYIDSTTGVVLAPKVQPGPHLALFPAPPQLFNVACRKEIGEPGEKARPHQVVGTINGTDVLPFFATSSQRQVPILKLGSYTGAMGKWLA